MKKLLILGFMILLLGCIQADYVQKVKDDGTSYATLSVEYKELTNQLASQKGVTVEEARIEMEEKLNENCVLVEAFDENVDCEVKGTKITVTVEVSGDEYYEFEKEIGLASSVYKIKIKKIKNLQEFLSPFVAPPNILYRHWHHHLQR